jgi:hypothetical protein
MTEASDPGPSDALVRFAAGTPDQPGPSWTDPRIGTAPVIDEPRPFPEA